MRPAWLLCALFALEPVVAFAAPRTPCDGAQAPAVVALADRLARSDDPRAWAGLMPAAAEAASAETFSTADRACAAYVAGSAAFFLSADRAVRPAFAVAAVTHFARAEALDPAAMAGRQPKSRMSTAWQRLGSAPGWLKGRKPIPFAIPAGPPGSVRLSPADPAAWADVCAAPECAVAIEVPRGDAPSTVSLRPGWYRVEHVGPCGARGEAVELHGGVLPVPDPAPCTAQLVVRDGAEAIEGWTVTADGAPIDGAAAPVSTALEVRAPGYLPTTVQAPETGGEVEVKLDRCAVALDVRTLPADAAVEGAEAAPWGPRKIRVTAPGHGPVEREVDVPPPDGDCAAATAHRVAIELPRPVSVVATDDAGKPVSIAKLLVQGEQVDPVGLFRVTGRYGLQAMHPTLGAVTTKFEVAPCAGADCGPVRVEVRFPPPPDKGGLGSTLAYVGGGVLMGLGGLAGIDAWTTHSDIQAYESKARDRISLDALVEQRDQAALAADVLLISGAALVLTGWLLSDAEDE